MRAAVFSFTFISDTSMIASVRIGRYIAEQLGVPYVDHRTIGDLVSGKKLDLLIIINGAYGFCKCLPELAELVLSSRRIVWVQNDYSIVPPKVDSKGTSPFRAAFRLRHNAGLPHMDFWTTCADWQGFTPHSEYVNWNALTFDDAVDDKTIKSRRARHTGNLFYYGSYRDGTGKMSRVPLFDRYFREPLVPTLISSPSDKFQERYTHEHVSHMGAIKENFSEFLGSQGIGLYIEDRKSSERFHSPANRFYEMLSAGLPMVFQPEAGTMLRKAGYDPTPYIVGTRRELPRMLENSESILRQQRIDWIGRDIGVFRRKLSEQFGRALRKQTELLK